MKQHLKWAILILAALTTGRAEAAFTITFLRVGDGTVATGSGSLNLTGLGAGFATTSGNGYYFPLGGIVQIGTPASPATAYNITINGPGYLGGVGDVIATGTGTGGPVGFSFRTPGGGATSFAGMLVTPNGYVSGTTFTSTSTFDGRLNATGTVTYTYSAFTGGPILDTITLQFGPAAAAVPEPASATLLCLGLAGAGWAGRRRSLRRAG